MFPGLKQAPAFPAESPELESEYSPSVRVLWFPGPGLKYPSRGQRAEFPDPIREPGFPLNAPESEAGFPGWFWYPVALYGQKELLPVFPG